MNLHPGLGKKKKKACLVIYVFFLVTVNDGGVFGFYQKKSIYFHFSPFVNDKENSVYGKK